MSPMNNRRMVPTQEPGILDFAPGAAAAYSLRNLSLSYVGPVVTVRRSTDDAEAEFTASQIDDGTLAAWCSGGDGFVKTWHDQSPNGRDATQTTAGYQPQIVDSGTLITEGGKAAVQFDGVDDRLVATGYKPNGSVSAFFVHRLRTYKTSVQVPFSSHKTTTPSGGFVLAANAASGIRDRILFATGLGGTWVDGAFTVDAGEYGTYLQTISFVASSAGSFLFRDAIQLFSDTAGEISAGNDLTIGTDSPSLTLHAAVNASELIIYPRDQTALRTRIEGNLAWTYSL